MNCNHCQRDQCPITCPDFGSKGNSEPKVEKEDDSTKWSWKMDYCKEKGLNPSESWEKAEEAYQKRKEIGCLNNKCKDWDSKISDNSNCTYLCIDELHKCAFYLDDPNEEWIKVKINEEDFRDTLAVRPGKKEE